MNSSIDIVDRLKDFETSLICKYKLQNEACDNVMN